MSTLPKLEPALSKAQKRALLAELLKEKARASESIHPLSYAQESMWFLYRLAPDSPAYNVAFTVRIRSAVDVLALQRTFQALIDRHPALRTTIKEESGEAFQVVHGHNDVYFEQIDASTWDDEKLHSQIKIIYQRPFDLERGPVFRVHLFTCSTTDHVLLLTAHHIIVDGWSIWVLLDEFRALYDAEVSSHRTSLPPLRTKYTDYVRWQRDRLAGPEGERLWKYWQQQLAGQLPVLNLPTDRPRPVTQTYNGATHVFELDANLTQQIKALGQAEGATLYVILLAAFQVLLSRYTLQEDVLIGSPVTDRGQAEFARVIGDFVNMVVLRANLSGNPSFKTFLKRTRQTVLDMLDHQGFPLPLLVDRLGLKRDAGRTPLFQVVFDLQRLQQSDDLAALLKAGATQRHIEFGGLELESYSLAQQEGQFDLILQIAETGDSLLAALKYNTDLFEKSTIARMEVHFQTLLTNIVANPKQGISTVPLLSAPEGHQLVVEWNETKRDYPTDTCLHELIEAQVEQTADAVAVVYEDTEVTYRELNARANQLAHYLRSLGVGPEVLVGLCLERSIEMVVGILGVLKAGGAYVPLDPSYPGERLVFMLEDAQVPVLLTQAHLVRRFLESSARVICLDRDWQVLAAESVENPANVVTPENLAYVIYTSGSTGKPKGAMNTHKGICNRLFWMQEAYQLTDADRVLQKTPFSFDVSVWEFFWPLMTGARLVIARSEGHRDSAYLVRLIQDSRITTLHFVPSMLKIFLEQAGVEACGSLKRVICSGEALPHELQEHFFGRLPGVELHNLYGPTEAAVDVTYWACKRGSPGSAVPIGRPIANTQLYILDAHLQPVPIGVPGELHIGGVGLARGYLNRPELTNEKFIANPFSNEPGARFYKTGDLTRYLPDGNIEFLGRIDNQVKIRGFRIELGEIESVLSQHPAVKEAVVLAREDAPGDQRLVTYVVPDQKSVPTIADLRSLLQARLPDYMIPAAFIFLEALPLSPNGKIDRKALPAPDQSALQTSTNFIAPRTPAEEAVADIWAQVLRVERVGAHDNFFELGGHSLLAIQVVSRAHTVFDVELPLAAFFEAPTVAAMAAVILRAQNRSLQEARLDGAIIDGESHANSGAELPVIVPSPGEKYTPFPLTDVQQAYWIGRSGAFELGNVATHGYVELDCAGLNVERLNTAWNRLIERHEMLRAVVLPDGQQQILERIPRYQIEMLDLRGQSFQEKIATLDGIREQMSHQVFQPDQWPLFSLRASQTEDALFRLHISRDILMADGWSWSILTRELCDLYQNLDATLPPLEISFRDYVLAEIAVRDSEQYRRSKGYWWKRLATLPSAPELPLMKDPGSVTSPRFVRRGGQLEPERWLSLKRRAAALGLGPTGAVLAAFSEVLKAWSKSPRFTVNLTLFNRLPLHPQVNDIVGDFTSLTLLAVDNSSEATFDVRAQSLQKQLWQDLDHRYVTGIEIMREIARRRRRVGGAMMPVVFTSMLGQDASDALSNELGKVVYGINQTSQVWLDHVVLEENGALLFCWDAVDELFPAGMLDDMFDTYCAFLQRLADDENAWRETESETARKLFPLRQLEQRVKVNDTASPITDGLLHTLFAARVVQRPQQPAVISSKRTLTYEELYRRANQIGHWLRQNGARCNGLVAVVMEKGWEQVAGVLGVLASGAAYLPIDAGLPKERLWHLLQHGEVELVLTQPHFDKKIEWPESVKRLTIEDGSLSGLSDQPLDQIQSPEDIAYVIYTSGSTGLPKGVVIDHRGAVNTILDLNRRFSLTPKDRVLALSSLSFDLSVYDIFGILAVGGTIVVPDAAGLHDPAHWADLVARHRVTLWNSVPALMQMQVEYLEGRGEMLAQDLRLVFMSGDWIPVALPERIRALEQDVEIVSMGGATEASIWSIIYPIEKVDPAWKSIPYGRPMVNQTFHVLNDVLEPCPVWVTGQLFIGGVGLAKGYWRDEEKTRASFITHPRTGERLYRTGDQGRYLSDGNIEFLGRDDFQVKIRGFRIELGEIESALSRHPAVRENVVAVREDTPGDKRLVAYVVSVNGSAPAIQDLREFLHSKLPDHMVPDVFVSLDSLPLSPNGKIDRKALPAPTSARPELGASVAPKTDLERTVAAVWREVLRLDEVGIYDNFFDLGGHSLLMVNINTQLQVALARDISMVELFRYPTISTLSEYLSSLTGQRPAQQSTDRANKQRSSLQIQRQRMQAIAQQRATKR